MMTRQQFQKKKEQANKLAQVAMCLDNSIWEENRKVSKANALLRQQAQYYHEKLFKKEIEFDRLQDSWQNVVETMAQVAQENEQLQTQIESMRNTMCWNEVQRLQDLLNDYRLQNDQLRSANRRLTEQLLDQDDSDWEANINYFTQRDILYRDV